MSSLSHWEYVSLVGNYLRVRDGNTVDPTLYDRGYTESQIKAMEERLKVSISSAKGANLSFSCNLDNFEYNQFDFVITTYRAYRDNGILPFSGPLADQPNKMIEIFNIVDQLKYEVEEREQRKADQEQTRLRKRK